jgi:hypothetical protein
VEVRLQGLVKHLNGRLILQGTGVRPTVLIVMLGAYDKVQWDHEQHARKAPSETESRTFEQLQQAADAHDEGMPAEVTGPLTQDDSGYRLHLRQLTLGA